jgi:enoyl-CoA hydratase/carnithine racemase
MEAIEADRQGPILILRIANEKRRNAFTHAMTVQLGEQLAQAEADPAVRCVIMTGVGDAAFSSGHDLREMLSDRDSASNEGANDPFILPARMSTPTIAAVNGYAYAVGFILALNCDLRVCAENAAFAAPGARIGLLPVAGQISRLPRLVPPSVAYELLVTCREMTPDEALRLGFVSRVTPPGGSVAAAMELAHAIVANSSHVIAEIKKGFRSLHEYGAADADRFEWESSRRLQAGPHAEEGMRAFLEKRRPNFA